MKDTDKSKQQLLIELAELRQHLAKLEQLRIECNRSEELVVLQKTALEITERHDLSNLLQGIVERATELLDARGGGLYLCESERRQVRCAVSYNTPHNYTGTTLKYGEGAAGTVAQTGKPLVIDDYRAWSRRAGVFEDEQPFTAILSTPMIWQGEVIGVIHVMDDVEARHFTQANLELLTLFANHAAIALQNARAEATLRESEERYRDLFENAHDLIQSVSPDGKFLYVNRAWRKALGYAEAEVANLTLFDIIHPDSQEHCRRVFQSVLTGEVVDNVEAILVSKTGKRIPVEGSVNCRLKDGKPVATRGIFRDITERKEHEKQLVYMAKHDQLTGVYNRHYFEEIVEQESKRGKRYEHPLGFVMVDVNKFKEINDRFGHQRGDRVLQEIAKLLREQTRETDFVVRYGGDEFIVVLVETDGKTKAVEERIREAVTARNEEKLPTEFPLTLAIGSYHWNPKEGKTLDSILHEVDKRMYEDKATSHAPG